MTTTAQRDEEPVWSGTVDKERFTAKVMRDHDDPYRGTLTVVVTDTEEEVLNQQVQLAYGARFGPDVSDVMEWQTVTVIAVDRWLVEHGEEPPRD